MAKFLTIYLAVTGIGALLALGMPSLVIVGLFLILPGLFLSLAPTAFLWGCVFTAFWLIARMLLGDGLAIVPALLATGAILWAIPGTSRLASEARLAEATLPDLLPATPIRPAGHVRIDIQHPSQDPKQLATLGTPVFACDNLCLTLLFAPGVESVTINSLSQFSVEEHRSGGGALATRARSYRLVRKADCHDAIVGPDPQYLYGLLGKDLDANREIAAEWNLKLGTDYCLVSEPPRTAYDLLIRKGRYAWPAPAERPMRWSLATPPAQVDYVELRDGGGRVLLRRLVSRVDALTRPLWIEGSGGLDNFRFGWGRREISNAKRHATVELATVLREATTLPKGPDTGALLERVRQRLRAALAEANPDPHSFATTEVWFKGIKAPRLAGDDLALAEQLILDPRVTEYRGLWELYGIAPDQHRQLRDAMVRRLLATDDTMQLRNAPFSDFLRKAPPGAYAVLTDRERRLIADPERRLAAPGLIARLSDGGAAMAPTAFELLRFHGAMLTELRTRPSKAPDHSRRFEAHSAALSGARIALCRLGSAAAPFLPRIEALLADGTFPAFLMEGHSGTDWNLMLLRLGKPIDTIAKPKNLSGTQANYRRNMAGRLSRFDPERSCDR